MTMPAPTIFVPGQSYPEYVLTEHIYEGVQQLSGDMRRTAMAHAAAMTHSMTSAALDVRRSFDRQSALLSEIDQSVGQGSAEVKNAIQDMADSVGTELAHIRFQLQAQSGALSDILTSIRSFLAERARERHEEGLTWYRVGELEKARVAFLKSLDESSHNYVANLHLGFIAFASEQIEDAARWFALSIKIAPNPAERARALALSSAALARMDLGPEAIRAARAAAEADPTEPSLLVNVARLGARFSSPEWEAALRAAIRIKPNVFGLCLGYPELQFHSVRLAEILNEVKRESLQTLSRARAALHARYERLSDLLASEYQWLEESTSLLSRAGELDQESAYTAILDCTEDLRACADQAGTLLCRAIDSAARAREACQSGVSRLGAAPPARPPRNGTIIFIKGTLALAAGGLSFAISPEEAVPRNFLLLLLKLPLQLLFLAGPILIVGGLWRLVIERGQQRRWESQHRQHSKTVEVSSDHLSGLMTRERRLRDGMAGLAGLEAATQEGWPPGYGS